MRRERTLMEKAGDTVTETTGGKYVSEELQQSNFSQVQLQIPVQFYSNSQQKPDFCYCVQRFSPITLLGGSTKTTEILTSKSRPFLHDFL